MRSDTPVRAVQWEKRTEPADLPEWMDEPCSFEDLRTCLRDLGRVNRLTLGYKPTLTFLDEMLAKKKPKQPVRILDVGFGGGDTLHRIARWSRVRGVTVELTGIDLNPLAKRAAEERFRDASVQWLTGDALEYGGEADVVISSLLTHHLATEDVVRFLRWMENTAILGWFVNDLERSARSASLFGSLARAMRWHAFVRHDGPISFARSFVPDDWLRMLQEAGVPSGAVELKRSFPSRLCVSRLK